MYVYGASEIVDEPDSSNCDELNRSHILVFAILCNQKQPDSVLAYTICSSPICIILSLDIDMANSIQMYPFHFDRAARITPEASKTKNITNKQTQKNKK